MLHKYKSDDAVEISNFGEHLWRRSILRNYIIINCIKLQAEQKRLNEFASNHRVDKLETLAMT